MVQKTDDHIPHEKPKYLIQKEILGEGVKVYWADLSLFGHERDEAFKQQQMQYRRTSNSKNCLVIEPIGTFFQLVNPNVNSYVFGDTSMRQTQTMIGGQLYLSVIKIWPMSLAQHLKKLAKYYELIVYTILPRETLMQIYSMIPGIEQYISHSLCYDQVMFDVFDGGYACKDLSYLSQNRKINVEQASEDNGQSDSQCEMIVVDILDSQESSDPRVVIYFSAEEFDGQVAYPNLTYLYKKLKQYRSTKPAQE